MASKRKAVPKKAPGRRKINIDIDVGGLQLTRNQKALLRKYVKSQVLTWVKDDVGEAPAPTITCNEHGFPPPDGGND